jgi:hypothetical protein
MSSESFRILGGLALSRVAECHINWENYDDRLLQGYATAYKIMKLKGLV